MSKSMLNFTVSPQNGPYNFPQNSPFTTPHKQKPTSVNINSSTLLRSIPQHFEPNVF